MTVLLLAFLAISPLQARDEADTWVLSRKDVILDRIETCIAEGNPRICHTAWASSNTLNTDPADNALRTQILDDPGRLDQCGLPNGQGTFSEAGIAIPASAPINAKINVAKSKRGWSVQLVIRIRYDGILYERTFSKGPDFEGYSWREVVE